MNIIIVFNKKEGVYPTDFPSEDDPLFDQEQNFCWKCESKEKWEQYTAFGFPEIKTSGLLLINDGKDSTFDEIDKDEVVRLINEKIDKTLVRYFIIHLGSENDPKTMKKSEEWNDAFKRLDPPMESARTRMFHNFDEGEQAFPCLQNFFRADSTLTINELIDKVFSNELDEEIANLDNAKMELAWKIRNRQIKDESDFRNAVTEILSRGKLQKSTEYFNGLIFSEFLKECSNSQPGA